MARSAPKDRVEASPAADPADPTEDGGAPLPEGYEAALAELDGLVARMEGGNLTLEESLAAYRRGAALVRFCQQQLEKVEHQVRVLDGETLKTVPSGVTAAGGAAPGGDDDL